MNFKNLVAVSAVGATMAFAVVGHNLFAQDDLDDLLKDLESDKTEEKAEVKDEAESDDDDDDVKVEAASKSNDVAEKKAEVKEEVAKDEPKAEAEKELAKEEPAEEAKEATEVKEEVAKDETPAKVEENVEEKVEAAKEVAEKSVAPKKDEEILSLLDELAAESKPEANANVAKKDAPKEEAEEPVVAEAKTEVAKEEVASEKSEEVAVDASVAKATEKPVVENVRPPRKDAALIEQIMTNEKNRREVLDEQAKREMNLARASMKTKEYTEAAKHYTYARKYLNDSQSSEAARRECEQGVAEALYRAAMQEDAVGRRDKAMRLMEAAVARRHPKARRQYEQWRNSDDPEDAKIDVSELTHRQNEDSYKASRAKILKHLKRARQMLGTKELDRALDECELVLIIDPYNQEAIRLREKIVRKMKTIVSQERKAAREGMIADVDKAWRPVYAVDAREIEKTTGQTLTTDLDKDPERAQEQTMLKRMREMILPEISFKPPATIYDAVQFFIGASKDYDRPELPLDQRGFGFQLITPQAALASKPASSDDSDDEGFGAGDDESSNDETPGLAKIPTVSVNKISFFDALTLICESVGYKFKIKNGIVVVMPKGMSTEEMVIRSYPVLSSFMDRMSDASSDMKEMKSSGFGGGGNNNDEATENKERDWKEFFSMLGVNWPEGSSIMYIKAIGKLRVKNTYENLAELEKALTEMNADPKLIEIEARFVEVCQEDLNSLGFEWILNGDYSLGLNKKLGRVLGIRGGAWGKSSSVSEFSNSSTQSDGSTLTTVGGVAVPGGTTVSSKITQSSTSSVTDNKTFYANSNGASWINNPGARRNIGVNGFGGEGSTYQTGMRYLSTLSNHISGEGYSSNDQFMRVNAFLGGADLSMILHMLSQRSDTDLLSAPKVLTRPGEEAVMKVVTEYIYPTDYDVQLQSSSSGSSGSSGSSQSAILAVVEPQSFTMREVGVILDVTPTLTDNGNLIDLKLNTQVVDEPTWKNYGMRIPFTGNSSLQSFEGIGGIFDGLASILNSIGTGLSEALRTTFAERAVDSATRALDNLSASTGENMTYYDVPMEQPFFHVRSIDSTVSVYPGATIVMGGLITEARKAMDDKIPFLGDLPFIGRFFRSHSEQTNKRNLLIFVTTRLVDVRGREVTMGSLEAEADKDVKSAPVAAAE